MANEKLKQNYKDIANAIRSKTGENGLIKADEMPGKIEGISTGVEPEGNLDITANGEYDIRLKNTVTVDVPGATTKDKLDVTANGEYNIAEYARVDVNVPIPSGYIVPEGNLNITANGTNIDVTAKATVSVAVPIPAGYIIPSGKLEITEAGTDIDVTNYASVDVSIDAPTFEASHVYITDGEGVLNSESGLEYDSYNETFFYVSSYGSLNNVNFGVGGPENHYAYLYKGDGSFDGTSVTEGYIYYIDSGGCGVFHAVQDDDSNYLVEYHVYQYQGGSSFTRLTTNGTIENGLYVYGWSTNADGYHLTEIAGYSSGPGLYYFYTSAASGSVPPEYDSISIPENVGDSVDFNLTDSSGHQRSYTITRNS